MSISIVERAQRHERAVRWLARFGFTVLTIVVCVQAQQRDGTVQTDEVQPVNSGANPYRVIRDWATLTLEKVKPGLLSAVLLNPNDSAESFVSRYSVSHYLSLCGRWIVWRGRNRL